MSPIRREVGGPREPHAEAYAEAVRRAQESVPNSPGHELVFGRHIAAVAATLPPDVVATAQERGRARDMGATLVELVAELGDSRGLEIPGSS